MSKLPAVAMATYVALTTFAFWKDDTRITILEQRLIVATLCQPSSNGDMATLAQRNGKFECSILHRNPIGKVSLKFRHNLEDEE